MKNKKYYLNENGLALISLTFILLSLVLVIFLTAYALGNEARKDTRRYITDLRTKRFHRAILGQRTEQSIDRTPIAMGGFLADYGLTIGDVYGFQEGHLYDRRYVSRRSTRWVPEFFYNPSKGAWSGYRGKRYLYPLPAEEWPEALLNRIPDDGHGDFALGWKDGEGEKFRLYHKCNSSWHVGTSSSEKSMAHRTEMTIKVKDYTCRANGALKLKTVLNDDGYPFGNSQDGSDPVVTETFAGYNMHCFYLNLDLGIRLGSSSQMCSRMIIYLQTENPAGSGNYVTMRTYPLFVQIFLTGDGDHNERRFVKNITYRESK